MPPGVSRASNSTKTPSATRTSQARLSNEFVAVKLDFEKSLNDAELSKQFATDMIPYIVFLDADGKKLSEFVGFLAPEDFLKELDKATQKAAKK